MNYLNVLYVPTRLEAPRTQLTPAASATQLDYEYVRVWRLPRLRESSVYDLYEYVPSMYMYATDVMIPRRQ